MGNSTVKPACWTWLQKMLHKRITIPKDVIIDKINKKYGGIISVDFSTYDGVLSRVKSTCNKCGHEWETTINDLLQQKYGCSKCAINARKLAIEEVRSKVEEIHGNSITVDYAAYKSNKTKMKCVCNICGHTWMSTSDMLIHKRGCRKCFEKRVYVSVEQAKERVVSLYGDSIFVDWDSYKNVGTLLDCRCSVCGYEWKSKLHQLTKNSGMCPNCARIYSRLPFDIVQQRIDLISNSTIKINKKEYVNTRTPVEAVCTKCGHSWKITANSLLAGSGCGACMSSKYEKQVAQFLSTLGVPYEHNKSIKNCINSDTGFSLRFDFVIPNSKNPKLIIETDGIQHFVNIWSSEDNFNKSCKRDSIKNDFAKANDILLLRVAGVSQRSNKHMSISELELLLKEHTVNGEIDFDALRAYDFNRQ